MVSRRRTAALKAAGSDGCGGSMSNEHVDGETIYRHCFPRMK